MPVDVKAIAQTLNIEVQEVKLEDSISAVLVVKEGRAIIGVNSAHNKNRKRFSIAHELGHFLLHSKTASSNVFVDPAPVFFRDEHSSTGSDFQEIQANAFAAELLMPASLLKEELRGGRIDAFDDDAIKKIADRFGVSIQALSIRLTNLGLISL